MELLLLPLIELAIPLVVGSVTLAVNALALVTELLAFAAAALYRLYQARRNPRRGESAPSPERRGKSRLGRRLFACTLLLLIVLLASVLIVNRYYFDPFMRWTAKLAEKSVGVRIGFDSVTGSIWSGNFNFANLSLARGEEGPGSFSVRAETVRADLNMKSLLRGRINFESLDIASVRGRWERRAGNGRPVKKRPFSIDALRLDDFAIDYRDASRPERPIAVTLKLDSMETVVWRSDWLWFSLLFLSEMEGAIDGSGFRVRRDFERGTLLWECAEMPLELLERLVGAPFDWFDKGDVTIRAENGVTFSAGWQYEVKMDWEVVFRDFHARTPPDASLKTRVAAAPLVKLLNMKRERLPLVFRLRLTPENTDFSSSEELDKLINALVKNGLRSSLLKLRLSGDGAAIEAVDEEEKENTEKRGEGRNAIV